MQTLLRFDSQMDADIRANCKAAGSLVGRREAKRAHVVLAWDDEAQGHRTKLVLDGLMTTPYDLVLASVRWSPTQGAYVKIPNLILSKDDSFNVNEWLQAGLNDGRDQWEAAQDKPEAPEA